MCALKPLHAYISNAIEIKDPNNQIHLGNRDIKCISLLEDSIKIVLKDYSSHRFFDFTKNNIGKSLSLSVCGAAPQSLKVMSPIPNGEMVIALDKNTLKYQVNCLKRTFETNKKCTICPVCKNK